jgi:hypothetical protein
MLEYTVYNTTTGEITGNGIMQAVAAMRFNRPGHTLHIGARLDPALWKFIEGQPVQKPPVQP